MRSVSFMSVSFILDLRACSKGQLPAAWNIVKSHSCVARQKPNENKEREIVK